MPWKEYPRKMLRKTWKSTKNASIQCFKLNLKYNFVFTYPCIIQYLGVCLYWGPIKTVISTYAYTFSDFNKGCKKLFPSETLSLELWTNLHYPSDRNYLWMYSSFVKYENKNNVIKRIVFLLCIVQEKKSSKISVKRLEGPL